MGPFGPKSGNPDFSGEIRLCQFSSFMVPILHARNQKNPWSRFPELLTNRQTNQQTNNTSLSSPLGGENCKVPVGTLLTSFTIFFFFFQSCPFFSFSILHLFPFPFISIFFIFLPLPPLSCFVFPLYFSCFSIFLVLYFYFLAKNDQV